MEALIIILIVAIGGIWFGVSTVIKKLSEGKEANNNLAVARSDIYDLRKKNSQLSENNKALQVKVDQLSKTIDEKDALYEKLKSNDDESIEYISSLMGDFLTLQYQISSTYLISKRNPAVVEAKRIRELKEETREIIQKYKLLQYKYEYLFQLFPDLELYFDDFQSIHELANINYLDKLQDGVDRTRHYLSRDEYNNLSENERNELALRRYIEKQKSKWQIGRDYELYIGYEYTKAGWDVEYFGIEKQVEDLGRDLIARKGDLIHVVQCKYWAQNKLIREKHIAQLFGTTIQLVLSSNNIINIVPVLVTNIKLSDTAKTFADYLKVRTVENKPFQEFPRIKCNISRDEFGIETKIYHLPMDQQYDKTKICKPGEFFAFTVEEAIKAGFRRAWKWHAEKG